MRTYLTILCILTSILGISSCNNKDKKRSKIEEIQYNPLVESFTTGTIGRKESLKIKLTEPLPANTEFKKHISIAPDVDGVWSISDLDARVLTFTPTTEFERGVEYKTTLNISKLFPLHSNQEEFSLYFSTLPSGAKAEFISITIDNEDSYTIKGRLLTADFEDENQIAKMVEWDAITKELDATIEWTHSNSGKEHYFTVHNVPVNDNERDLTLTVNDSEEGYEKEELLSIIIPKKETFEIHSVDYFNDKENYIEVRFTKRLDPKQDINGLVWLEGIESVKQIESNKILIYPEASAIDIDENGTFNITLNVNKALRTTSGNRLAGDIIQVITVEQNDPEVRFLSSGTIVPPKNHTLVSSNAIEYQNTKTATIPFQAVSLRAVRVDVIRVLEKSILQYLQDNSLKDQSPRGMVRTARPVASKTIFLDEQGTQNLKKWSSYSINLNDLIVPEPGALYCITLSFDHSMAIIPCINPEERLTKQAAKTADDTRLKRMIEVFDGGGYYSNSSNKDWSQYNWREREDPCKKSYYFDTEVKRNLLVTDLGVIAKSSGESNMLLLVNSLSTAEPIERALVVLKNYQGQKIAEGTTNIDGQVVINHDGRTPYYAVVSRDKQHTYLKVNSGSELSTSTFDVAGEQIQNGLRGFIWTERGVWRPGDTIYMNFVMTGEKLPENHPVTVELRSPLGQLYQKQVATKAKGGIHSFVLSTDAESPTGVWSATVTVGGVKFEKRLRIEAVKPNRLKIDLKFPNKFIQRDEPLNATLHGEWLTGAKIANLKYSIETTFSETNNSFEAYKDYMFNNQYQSFDSESIQDITGVTDANGNATIKAKLNVGERAGGMLIANITTRLFEPSGEASVNGVSIPYSPYTSYVGILPPAGSNDRLDTDKDYSFKIATVTPSGKPKAYRDVVVTTYKVNWYWWWRAESNTLARHVSDQGLAPMDSKTIKTSNQGLTSYNLNIPRYEWGTYYITAKDTESGHESAVLVYMDWPDYGNRNNDEAGAMRLAVSLDKNSYNVGDKAIVSFPATKESRAIISVENGSEVLKTFLVKCDADKMKYTFDVTADMQPNVYLNVTLLQPHATVENDLPVRLYGIIPLVATSAESRLNPIITCPDDVLPESEMSITVSEESGRPMSYTLAIVDEGLLDLTRFRTPNPWIAFNARVALGVTTWDVYNDVLGGYGGKIEQMFAIGGDDALGDANKPAVNRFPPMVKYVGVFELKPGQEAKHKIQLPAYMGKVRVMAVAISTTADNNNGAWGSSDKSVTVRSPLMVLGSAPRAVVQGDEIIVPATLITTQDNVGSVRVAIKVDKKMFSIVGEEKFTIKLDKQGDKMVFFRLKVKDDVPVGYKGGRVELSATSKNTNKSSYVMDIPIRTLSMPISGGESYTIAAGKKLEKSINLHGMDGTQRLMLEVSSILPINSAQRMEYLSKYPYGCIEQITSTSFPILYLIDILDLSGEERASAQNKIRYVLNKYKDYATPEGMMGYWTGSTYPNMWGSAYALHFMAEANNRGYAPSPEVYKRLKTAIKNSVVRWSSSSQQESNSLTQAYKLYALALAGEFEFGAMNRLRQSEGLTKETKWMLAAAYAVAGRVDIGKSIVNNPSTDDTESVIRNQRRMTYGSPQRATAVELLATSLLGMDADAASLALNISNELSSKEWMSTQTAAWCMLSIGEYFDMNGKVNELNFNWTVDGKSEQVVSSAKKMTWSKQWENPKSGAVSILNYTKGALNVRLVSSGISSGHGIVAASSGVRVTVSYKNSKGYYIDVANIVQGSDFISEVTVVNLKSEPIYNLMLTEPVASGWEIRPDAKLSSDDIEYQDIRDDRVDVRWHNIWKYKICNNNNKVNRPT